mmetsp:Transcript_96670/g.211373  ORF Transcript_96670/g.211373 Transcript_96670/m.211373 type:complete len:1079 (+) Transcript_96670:232-3468(+)|eukprot:CAMPEP_0206574680 /NCGR_PEP_ID=MMETSP0325_2-20121206/29605_1 /ASSEMBLY_ACC=CAM_ASM_000347 /TAXON_ID=2866 /ORGANISM="Crypthecodinium cohnii, Strain Seligo" /LENGTH=1078 /DNA_ID=CAMNT_0054079361 /DNA_START=128 /DNA_END=3364 /DNA_ORIENTATION=-
MARRGVPASRCRRLLHPPFSLLPSLLLALLALLPAPPCSAHRQGLNNSQSYSHSSSHTHHSHHKHHHHQNHQNKEDSSAADEAIQDLLQRATGDHQRPRRPICGGHEIGRMLGLGETPRVDYLSIKSIPWQSIMKEADAYISEQNKAIGELQEALLKYSAQLPEVKLDGVDGKQPASSSSIKNILVKVLEESFGCLSNAISNGCGVQSQQSIDGYEAAETSFTNSITSILDGKFWVGRQGVEEVCKQLLMMGDADHAIGSVPDSVCDDLCRSFGAIAESKSRLPSDYEVGGEMTFDDLSAKVKDAHEKLTKRQRDVGECEADRAMLMEFGARMHADKVESEAHFKKEREALVHLRQVQKNLYTTSQDLKKQSEATLKLSGLLKSEETSAQGMRLSLVGLAKQESELTERAHKLSATLKALQQKLAATGEATRTVKEFKTTLEVVMRDLVQVYDTSVREPLRQQGLMTILTQLQNSRWPRVSCLGHRTEKLADGNAASLEEACEEVVASIGSVEGGHFSMTLEELKGSCAAQKAKRSEYMEDILSIIAARQREIVLLLNQLRCYAEPFECAKMDDSIEKKGIASGEPSYMLRLWTVYGNSTFYKDYASSWQVGQLQVGVLLQLYKKLQALYRTLVDQEAQTKSALALLVEGQAKTLSQKEGLNTRLTELLQEERCEELKTLDAQRAIREYQANIDQLSKMEELFNKTVSKALSAYEDAKRRMELEFKLHGFVRRILADPSEGGEAPKGDALAALNMKIQSVVGTNASSFYSSFTSSSSSSSSSVESKFGVGLEEAGGVDEGAKALQGLNDLMQSAAGSVDMASAALGSASRDKSSFAGSSSSSFNTKQTVAVASAAAKSPGQHQSHEEVHPMKGLDALLQELQQRHDSFERPAPARASEVGKRARTKNMAAAKAARAAKVAEAAASQQASAAAQLSAAATTKSKPAATTSMTTMMMFKGVATDDMLKDSEGAAAWLLRGSTGSGARHDENGLASATQPLLQSSRQSRRPDAPSPALAEIHAGGTVSAKEMKQEKEQQQQQQKTTQQEQIQGKGKSSDSNDFASLDSLLMDTLPELPDQL